MGRNHACQSAAKITDADFMVKFLVAECGVLVSGLCFIATTTTTTT
jgi:hypothetical protein